MGELCSGRMERIKGAHKSDAFRTRLSQMRRDRKIGDVVTCNVYICVLNYWQSLRHHNENCLRVFRSVFHDFQLETTDNGQCSSSSMWHNISLKFSMSSSNVKNWLKYERREMTFDVKLAKSWSENVERNMWWKARAFIAHAQLFLVSHSRTIQTFDAHWNFLKIYASLKEKWLRRHHEVNINFAI